MKLDTRSDIGPRALRAVPWTMAAIAVALLLGGCDGQDAKQAVATAPARSDARPRIASRPLPALAPEAAGVPGSRHFSGQGVNLSSFDYWSTDFPAIDQFKRASPWITGKVGVFDTGEEDRLPLDAQGWVTRLPDANDANVRYRYVTALLFQGDGGAHPVGDYTVLYDGDGRIEYPGLTRVSSQPGRDVVRLDGRDGEVLTLQVVAIAQADPLRNIRVIPPGGICSLANTVHVPSADSCAGGDKGAYVSLETLLEAQKQMWFPNFLGDLSGMRTLRFMDWGRTNTSTLVRWADRPKWDDATWTGEHGVPVSAMINLANATKTDAWINLPTQVDDDYARAFARLAKANLNPSAKLVLEYSNEPWNTAFYDNYKWQLARAIGDWHVDPDKDDDPETTSFGFEQNWHAMRSANLCDIVKAEFGAEAARVQCVVNTQAAGGWWNAVEASLKCPYALASRSGRPCADSFDAVAIAPYFGLYIGHPDRNVHKVHREIVERWFTESDGGIARLFEEIRAKDANGAPLAKTPLHDLMATAQPDAVGGALSQSGVWMRDYQAHVANNPDPRFRKPVFAYEGGQHLLRIPYACVPFDPNHPDRPHDPDDCPQIEATFNAKWQPLILAANRHPLMGSAYEQMMLDWRASSGQAFMQFNFVNAYSTAGMWGLRESLFKTAEQSPKWRAVLPYRDSIPCWWKNCAR